MRLLNPEYEREDHRGKLTQLITGSWKQANLIEIKKGKKFGGHYHKKKKEYFYILYGHVMMSVKIDGVEQTVFLRRGHSFIIEPYETHTLEATEDTSIVELLSKPYDEKDVYE